jgi:hypothetical protein
LVVGGVVVVVASKHPALAFLVVVLAAARALSMLFLPRLSYIHLKITPLQLLLRAEMAPHPTVLTAR